jgi:hypothetical protein
VPREDASAVVATGFDDVLVLLVVNEHVRLVSLEDAAQLRLGDLGVQEDDLMAEPRSDRERLDEPAVVPAEDRERRPTPTARPQRAGDRLDSLVELVVRRRAVVVDDGVAVGMPRGTDRDRRRRRQASAPQPADDACARARPDGTQQTGLRGGGGGVLPAIQVTSSGHAAIVPQVSWQGMPMLEPGS